MRCAPLGSPAWLLSLALPVLLTGAHGDSRAAEEHKAVTYIGTLEGAPASARIALVADGTDVVAYLCSQDAAFNKDYAHWFTGKQAADGGLKAGGTEGQLVARRDGTGLTGSVKFATRELAFTAEPAADNGVIGLYRGEAEVEGGDYLVGIIIDKRHVMQGKMLNRKTGKQRVIEDRKGLAELTLKKEKIEKLREMAKDNVTVSVDERIDKAIIAEKVQSPKKMPKGQVVTRPELKKS